MDDDWDDFYIRRPRFQLATGFADDEEEESSFSPSKFHIGVFSAIGVVLLASAIYTFGFLQSVLVWFGLSFLIGPHLPSLYTYGDCRVGVGDELPDPEPEDDSESDVDAKYQKRGRGKNLSLNASQSNTDLKVEDTGTKPDIPNQTSISNAIESREKDKSDNPNREWSNSEIERLKKALLKFPRGTPRRWEQITKHIEGRKAMEDVISMAGLLSKKPDGKDDYSTFLANRKTSSIAINSELSQRDDGATAADGSTSTKANGQLAAEAGADVSQSDWTEAEDLALVKALKEFTKETPLRWEKVSNFLSSKTKQECIKRFSELKINFKLSRNKTGADLSGLE